MEPVDTSNSKPIQVSEVFGGCAQCKPIVVFSRYVWCIEKPILLRLLQFVILLHTYRIPSVRLVE